MKLCAKISSLTLLALAAVSSGYAQVQPVVSVSITAPLNEASAPYNPAVPLTITAAATGQSPFTYAYFVDGTPLSGSTASISWTPPNPGAYFLTATVTDAASNKATSLPVRYFATGTKITSPSSGTLVPNGSSVVIQAAAAAAGGFVQRVEFYVDGTLTATDLTFPYSFIYTPATTPTSHTVEARAFDNNGTQVSASGTATVSLTMVTPVATAPTVSIASPTNGAVIPVSATATTVTVNAISPAGFINKVELYIDGVLFGTKTTSPYTFAWTPQVAGAYHLVALGFDDKNNSIASSGTTVTVGASGLAPTVTVTSPTSTSSVAAGSATSVTATAVDSDGIIASVQFFVNGASIGTDTTFPYSAPWTPVNPGTYSLTARAIDNDGNAVTSAAVSVTVTAGSPPVVTLINPDANISVAVGTPVNLTATAGTATGTIASVRFVVNGTSVGTVTTAPYTATFTPTLPGTYSIVAEATNSAGITASSTARTITAVSGALSVFLLSPEEDTSISTMSSLLLSAAASTSSGTITKVEFYAGTTLLATKTAEPYSFTWNPTVAATYVVRAVAYDSLGNSISSSGVAVTVSSTSTPRGTFYAQLTNPTDGAVLRAFRNITFSATTNISNDVVTAVDFYANGALFGTATALPYQVTRNPTVPGVFEFHAVVRGNGFALVSPPVRVTVVPNDPPSVTITSPTTGNTVLVGNQVTLRASATDPDDQIDNVSFLVNGQVLSSDNTFPYSVTWSPTSEGVYTINAIVKDNQGSVGGNEAVSAPIYVRVVGAVSAGGAGGGNSVYAGTYIAGAEAGRFSVITIDGKKATLIARSTLGVSKTYFYNDMTVDASGGFTLSDSTGKVLVSGATNDSGTTGTFDSGRAFFIGSNLGFSPVKGVVSGYYTGSLDGRMTSALVAIVGADGSIMTYVRDGTFADAADGKVDLSGNFNVVSFSGNRLAGKIDPVSGFITGTMTGVGSAPSGKFSGTVTAGATFSDGVLRGLSTRGFVGTGNNILIAGFVINGTTSKQVIIRGLGPSMAGVSGTLADPQLQLFNGSTSIATNNNWTNDASTRAAMAQVGLGVPASSLESVLIATLAPGAYTVQLSGVGATTGNALVELYDLDTAQVFTAQKVRALSTRGFVGASGSELIAGFVVTGTISKKVLIQAAGPAIAGSVAGTLADPVLRVYRFTSAGAVLVRENDNWEVGNDGAIIVNAINSSGANPLAAGSKDAALLMDLPPGTYTAVVSGANNTTGIAIVNTYEVP